MLFSLCVDLTGCQARYQIILGCGDKLLLQDIDYVHRGHAVCDMDVDFKAPIFRDDASGLANSVRICGSLAESGLFATGPVAEMISAFRRQETSVSVRHCPIWGACADRPLWVRKWKLIT